MSDHFTTIVPAEPGFVPPPPAQEEALRYFQMIAPEADEIGIENEEHIVFFDCGSNFVRILCPGCGEKIPIEWWHDTMNEDYDGSGFHLTEHKVPCCGAGVRLNELQYEWPQAFGRFAIKAMNANIGEASGEQRLEFERILGTPVIVVYQHL